MRVNLTLPSSSLLILSGAVSEHVPPGGMDGRGPGVDVRLEAIPQTAMWLIESALSSVRREASVSQALPQAAADQARRRALTAPTVPPTGKRTSSAPPDPNLDDGDEVVEAEDQLIAALRQEYESLKRLNPFHLLGLGYTTTDEEVRASFGELTKRYHPDRFARYQSGQAREYASEIFILIRDAYRKLDNPGGRARVLDVLRNRRPPAPRPGRTPAGQTLTRPRQTTAPRGSQQPAERSPSAPAPGPQGSPPPAPSSTAASLPGADLDRAAALLEDGSYEEALALYAVAARREPANRQARAGIELGEGLRALAQRDRLEAAQRFEAVLEIDPTNERAARELAEMRRQATNERKGLLTRLLGKEA